MGKEVERNLERSKSCSWHTYIYMNDPTTDSVKINLFNLSMNTLIQTGRRLFRRNSTQRSMRKEREHRRRL